MNKISDTEIYTYQEAMDILGVKKTTMAKLIKEGKIRYIRLGKTYRFLAESLLYDLKKIEQFSPDVLNFRKLETNDYITDEN